MSIALIESPGAGLEGESAPAGFPNWSPKPKRLGGFFIAMLLLLACVGCAAPRGQSRVSPRSPGPEQAEVGVASYYAHKYHGKKTASGENYNMHELTAAHRTLPFGSKVRITNLNNNNSVVVRINDRGPFVRGRIIDVSLAAARELDMVRSGVARVEVAPLAAREKRWATLPP